MACARECGHNDAFMRPGPFLLILLLTFSVSAADSTPYSVASLVHEQDAAKLRSALTEALGAPAPLVRATAARVIAVRELSDLLPQVRTNLDAEADATAAREQIRTLGLLGSEEDIAAAVKVSARWPAGMDDALAVAVARRGATNALPIYNATLKETRMNNAAEFFRIALWGQSNMIPFTGSRMLGSSDEAGWRGLLSALADSHVPMNPGVMATSLDAEHEGIRSASIWYLVRGYAPDPSSLHALIIEKLKTARPELSSDREDFGRELLRRMLGGDRVNDPRWLKFLASEEADALLAGDTAALQYLTDDEYAIRYNRCEVQVVECALPAKRSAVTIPSQPVAPPAFTLPELLPAGLADAIVKSAVCRDSWLGVASATVDHAGRVKTLDLKSVKASPSCKTAIDTLIRISFANNTSLRSAFSGPVLLAHSHRSTLCLDENQPAWGFDSTFRVGGSVQPPKVKKRVEPQFPDSAIEAMGAGRNVFVLVESVISSTGCVRSMRILEQSPFPAMNGAALMALSQWTFTPGAVDGKPVDVIFNMLFNFKTR